MIEPASALQHWAKWAVDNGSWRRTCAGIEKRYVFDAERYVHADDAEKRLQFRYDMRTGESVERIVVTLPDAERRALIARHVHWPHLADDIVARRLGMSARSFDAILLAATVRFGRLWRDLHREAA